ncbi:hypothetical protein DFJ77DRAFT_261951 [Powellomyces hirtus]|nr:hypothetical protein DFJ77DRAFT_261951 [Powellomyces hirtus]
MMEIDTSNIINPNQDNKPPKRKRRSSATETSDPPEHDRASKRRMDTLENPNNHVGVNNTKRESFSQAEDSTRPSLRREATEEDPLSPRLPDSQKTRKKSDNSRKASNQSNSRGGRSTRAPRQSQSSGTSRSKNNSQPIVTSNSATTVEEAPEEHPVKTRIPHAKSSLGEMNKRVKQLSDYITRLQVSMAAAEPCVKLTSPSPSASIPDDCPSGLDSSSDTRTSSQNKFNMTPVKTERHPPMDTTTMTSTRIFNLAILTPGGQMMTGAVTTSPTGSEPAVCSPQTPARAETSFEMLDRLNLSLIRFQERFGSLNTKR